MIDHDDLKRIAELARLRLTDDEADRLARDCGSILEHFDAIRGLDVTGAEPAGELELAAPLREDRVDGDPLRRRPQEMAPAWRDGFYVLPRLPAMEGEAAAGDEPDG